MTPFNNYEDQSGKEIPNPLSATKMVSKTSDGLHKASKKIAAMAPKKQRAFIILTPKRG